jgi:shikimate dehydrogenase
MHKCAALETMMNDTVYIPSPQGATRLFVQIGDPVIQVQAPRLMNKLFAEREIDAVMVAMHIPAPQIDRAIEGLKAVMNLVGIVVTVPHKFAICEHADALSPTARLAGSANALRLEPDGSWSAENFDGLGFVQGLRSQGHELRGKRVLLVGAGGAGVAIAAALVQSDIEHLTIADTSHTKAAALVDRLVAYRPGIAVATQAPHMEAFGLAINATPLGMRPDDPLPFVPDGLPKHAVVVDIIMKPAQTRLLEAAAASGRRTHQGMHMLTPQIEMYAEFFGVGRAT